VGPKLDDPPGARLGSAEMLELSATGSAGATAPETLHCAANGVPLPGSGTSPGRGGPVVAGRPPTGSAVFGKYIPDGKRPALSGAEASRPPESAAAAACRPAAWRPPLWWLAAW